MTDSSNNINQNNNHNNDLKSLDGLSQYLKSQAGTREGRSIPPLENWHPTQVDEMDLVIKANGEWWHEGSKVTRQSLVSLFATVLWREKQDDGSSQYYLKTPVQKLKITVEDVPLLINDVGIVQESGVDWLEFTTTTGDVVRLDEAHPITLRALKSADNPEGSMVNDSQIRPYMAVRNDLDALIGRNTFYHLTELGDLTEQDGQTTLTLSSGGQRFEISMPSDSL